jgi:hypothetical protein
MNDLIGECRRFAEAHRYKGEKRTAELLDRVIEELKKHDPQRVFDKPKNDVHAARLKRAGLVEVNSPHDCDDPTSPPPFQDQQCRCSTPDTEVKP